MCGLRAGTKVICGGVDNSCMALGTTGIGNGRVYTSLGSSAWIAVIRRTNPSLMRKNFRLFLPMSKKDTTLQAFRSFPPAILTDGQEISFCSDLSGDPFAQMDALACSIPCWCKWDHVQSITGRGSSQEPSEVIAGGILRVETFDHTAGIFSGRCWKVWHSVLAVSALLLSIQ